jgi:tRNA pseudouridine38-40 synthase
LRPAQRNTAFQGSNTPVRYRMDLAYDGTDYAGWQIQPNSVTIQEKVQAAIAELTGEKVKIHGSGRTDQGVHARRQVAHFDLSAAWAPLSLAAGLNALLPDDIRVARVAKTAPVFHARRSAVSKEYRYFIWNGDVVPPFVRHFRARVKRPLDVAAMQAAAAHLVGRHDFAAFTANPNREVESTVRTLQQLRVTRKGSEVTIVALADGFLYRMVRSLAGFLVRVGEGAILPGEAAGILSSGVRTARVQTAPAAGLFLWKVTY